MGAKLKRFFAGVLIGAFLVTVGGASCSNEDISESTGGGFFGGDSFGFAFEDVITFLIVAIASHHNTTAPDAEEIMASQSKAIINIDCVGGQPPDSNITFEDIEQSLPGGCDSLPVFFSDLTDGLSIFFDGLSANPIEFDAFNVEGLPFLVTGTLGYELFDVSTAYDVDMILSFNPFHQDAGGDGGVAVQGEEDVGEEPIELHLEGSILAFDDGTLDAVLFFNGLQLFPFTAICEFDNTNIGDILFIDGLIEANCSEI